MKLIVGLGNHGKKYEQTRHNIGWDVVSFLAKTENAAFHKKDAFKCELAETRLTDEKVLLAHPLTYMNASGEAVALLKNYYKLTVSDILIVQDEMDFIVGKFAFLKKGGPAGHNGLISIQEQLATTDIARLRIGIGRPTPPVSAEAYVLQLFHPQEQSTLKKLFPKLEDALKDWAIHGIDKTMNTWNGVESDKK